MTEIDDSNLTRAWIHGFKTLLDEPGKSISPLLFSVGPIEEDGVRISDAETVIDQRLQQLGQYSIVTTANTIFPDSLWNRAHDRDVLFDRYLRILPRISGLEQDNSEGTYFSRLIAYPGTDGPVNQLEHLIEALNQGVIRRSALHATIFSPSNDHSFMPRQAFPCLRDIFLDPQPNGNLTIGGLYATQNIFGRAYGNLLGLYRLGQFIAHETDFRLQRILCVACRERLSVNKRDVRALSESLEQFIG